MNYLFYDLETSGTDHSFDQIVQFAAVKTDSELNQIEEPVNFLCKLRKDVIPSPYAFITTCINMEALQTNGLIEYEFAKKINEVLCGNGNQCIVGYNSKSFDDKMIQFLLYRNLMDPYQWFWNKDNSRLDIYDLVKLSFTFSERVPSFKWLEREGKVSLRLKDITTANHLSHDNAHDALSDVYATIQIANLIKNQNSNLFEHILKLRNKGYVNTLVTPPKKFFYCDSCYGQENRYLSCQEMIGVHPTNRNAIITWNLSVDPAFTLKSSPVEIRDNMYVKKETKKFEVGFTEIKTNQCPAIVPYFNEAKTNIDMELCEKHSEIIRNNLHQLRDLIKEIFLGAIPRKDVDANLYAGEYFKDRENDNINLMECMKDITNPHIMWRSERFNELHNRLRWRNYSEILDDGEKRKYKLYLRKKYYDKDFNLGRNYDDFKNELKMICEKETLSDKQKRVLKKLDDYVQSLVLEC